MCNIDLAITFSHFSDALSEFKFQQLTCYEEKNIKHFVDKVEE